MAYVEIEKVLETARNGYHSDFGRSMADLTSLQEVLEDTPTADVVEVKHGYWVYEVKYYSCSNCAGKRFNLLLGCDAEYCPYCGAKMDGTPKERGGEK